LRRHHQVVERPRRQLELPVPEQLIDAIADRVAEIILERLTDGPRSAGSGRWMRSNEAASYLGWSRSALYDRVSRKAMPHYKVDGILLFKRDELDAWLEQYREEPRAREPLYVQPSPLPRSKREKARATPPTPARGERSGEEASKKNARRRPRPLPPPIGGDEEHKDHWARELEISRAELDEMSPSDFRKAWDERNQRLEEGGVFAHVSELTDAHGWDVIDKMTPSELIKAVADLGLPSEGKREPAARERE
jgi:excisionase family DNA binding protein